MFQIGKDKRQTIQNLNYIDMEKAIKLYLDDAIS